MKFYSVRLSKHLDCSQSPIFCEIVKIQCVLQLMAAILIFKCTEGAGVGDYSSRFFSLPPKLPSSTE